MTRAKTCLLAALALLAPVLPALEPDAIPALRLGVAEAAAGDPLARGPGQGDGLGWTVGGLLGPVATWRHLDPALRGAGGAQPVEADGAGELWGRASLGRRAWFHALVQGDTLRPIPSPGAGSDRWGMAESHQGNWQASVAEAFVGGTLAETGTTLRVGRLPQWIGLPGGTLAESWRVRPGFIAWNRATPDGVQLDQALDDRLTLHALVARQVFAPELPAVRKETFDLAYGLGATLSGEHGWATLEGAFDDSVSHDLRRDRHAHVLAFSLNGAWLLRDGTTALGDLGWGRNPDSDQYLVRGGLAQRLAAGLTATLQAAVLPQIVRGSTALDDRITAEAAAALLWNPADHLSLAAEAAVIRTDAKDANGETVAIQAAVTF